MVKKTKKKEYYNVKSKGGSSSSKKKSKNKKGKTKSRVVFDRLTGYDPEIEGLVNRLFHLQEENKKLKDPYGIKPLLDQLSKKLPPARYGRRSNKYRKLKPVIHGRRKNTDLFE